MANIYGRQVVEALTNKSGGAVVAGDVVIIDTSNNDAFTTTTTGRYEGTIGIAQEAIANNAAGRVLLSGYASLVNVPASVTRGHYLETHTVAKQATGNGTRRSGSAGQFRTGGTTPTAVLWGKPDPTVSAGAPDLSGLVTERSVQGVTDTVAMYDASATASRGVPPGSLQRSRQHTVQGSDCWYPESLASANVAAFDGPFVQQLNVGGGSGAALSAGTSTSAHPGVTGLATGSGTTARVGISTGGSAVVLGAGKVRYIAAFKLDTLSDGTNTYTVYAGLSTAVGSDGTDAVEFRYSHGVNGGEWQGVCRSGSSESGSVLDTNVAADTGWHTFEFEINAAGTSVEFFIDGNSVGTVSTNVPSAALRLMPINVIKSAGSTSRTFQVDMFSYAIELASAR